MKAFLISNFTSTSGSLGSEFSESYIDDRIFEEEAAGILLQVGRVEISKKVWEDKMDTDEGVEVFVIPHKQGRHQLACTPAVYVCGADG